MRTIPLGRAALLLSQRPVTRLPVSQKPSTLNGLEMAVTLPAVAERVKPNCPRLIARLPNVAVPVASVVWASVPPRVAAAQGGVPLKLMVILALGIGVLVLSVTSTCTGEPV